MKIVTRFAPSPTGFLHIGSARTALFNWLYAKKNDGDFLLRIEDTDKKRSSNEATKAILSGLKWLGLDWDEEEIYQSKNANRHKEIAEILLQKGHAYKCYCTNAELDQKREQARSENKPLKLDNSFKDSLEPKEGVKPVIRLKIPASGEVVIEDQVQGKVVVKNSEQDDLIILRADETPTYMLAVVVDDYDMGVTHIIRGDDHLTNSFKQKLIYDLMGWKSPVYCHIPLIYGPDGAKMSKRHGAIGVDKYQEMGYLPEAISNYLLRLGWSYGDDEIIALEQAAKIFDIKNIGKSPSRFDFAKLDNINSYYIANSDDIKLAIMVIPKIEARLNKKAKEAQRNWIIAGMKDVKSRVNNINDIVDLMSFYVADEINNYTGKAKTQINEDSYALLKELVECLKRLDNWNSVEINNAIREFAKSKELGLGKVMMPLRAVITGSHVSPDMCGVLEIIGISEIERRVVLT